MCFDYDGTLTASVNFLLLDVLLSQCHYLGSPTDPDPEAVVVGTRVPLVRDVEGTRTFVARCVRDVSPGTAPAVVPEASLGAATRVISCDTCDAAIDCRALSSGEQDAGLVTAKLITDTTTSPNSALCACAPATTAATEASAAFYFPAPVADPFGGCAPLGITETLPATASPTLVPPPTETGSRSASLAATVTATRGHTQTWYDGYTTPTLPLPPTTVAPAATTAQPTTAAVTVTGADNATATTSTTAAPVTTDVFTSTSPLDTAVAPVTNTSTTSVPNTTAAVPPATNATTPEPPTPAPTPAPTEKNTTAAPSKVAAALESVMPSAAASAVSSTSSAAVVMSSAANPAAATKGANLANIVAITDCAFTSDSLEPSAWQVVLPIRAGGERRTTFLWGGVVTTLGFTWLFYALDVALGVGDAPRKLRRVMGVVAGAVACYMLPSTASFAMLLMFHGSDGTDAFVGFVGIAGTVVAVLGPAIVIQLKVTLEFGSKKMASATQVAGRWYFAFLILAEGCVDTRSTVRRQMFTEDVLVAVAIGAISGIQPLDGACSGVGFGILAVAVLHLLYAIVIRPYESRLDSFFMIAIAVGQVAACVCAIVSMNQPGVLVLVGFIALLQTALFAAQTVAMGVVGYLEQRRKQREKKREARRQREARVAEVEQLLLASRDPSSPTATAADDAARAAADAPWAAALLEASGTSRPAASMLSVPETRAERARRAAETLAAVDLAVTGGLRITGPLVLPPGLAAHRNDNNIDASFRRSGNSDGRLSTSSLDSRLLWPAGLDSAAALGGSPMSAPSQRRSRRPPVNPLQDEYEL